MDFELPILRVDTKEYLEALQAGQLYLRNNIYYQGLKNDNGVRGDPHDGSLPMDGIADVQQYGDDSLNSMRITRGSAYIKCFFHYKEKDVEKINDRFYRLKLSPEARESLLSFHSDHVMVIFSPIVFVCRVSDAADKYGDMCYARNVEYLSEEGLRQKTQELITGLKAGKLVCDPIFCKREDLKDQQEFRVCVHHLMNELLPIKLSYGIEQYDITQEYIDTPYTIDIGSIKDISYVFELKDFLEHSLIYDVEQRKYMIRKEEAK